MYPDLNAKWVYPIPHEKKIQQSNVNEIFFERALLFFMSAIVVILLTWNLDVFYSYRYFILYFILVTFLLGLPIYLKQWEIILSNKRLILRSKYWFVGRFSNVISFNLRHLDSQGSSPRVKIIPLLIGFGIIFSYGLPVLQFSITGTFSKPVIIQLLLIFTNLVFPIINFEMLLDDGLIWLMQPFTNIIFQVGIIFFLLGSSLVIFGLPRKKSVVLSSVGGHKITLRTGLPHELSKYLYGVGRKHRISDNKWEWDIPLLEDEKIEVKTNVGLIDRKSQLLGLLSLVLSFDSISRVFHFVVDPSIGNIFLLIVTLIGWTMSIFSIRLAKKYTRIYATNHRLLFQDEIKTISGLYGKRIFRYSDLPYDNIRGFSYSNSSGYEGLTLIRIVIIIGGSSYFAILLDSLIPVLISIMISIVMIFTSYVNKTILSFYSLSGETISLQYRIPALMIQISHKIEERTIYDRIFPSILSEHDVISLCNTSRGITNPKINLREKELHEVRVEAFLGDKEEIKFRSEKYAPFKYAKSSIFIGFTLGSLLMHYLSSKYLSSYQMPVAIIVYLSLFVLSAKQYVMKYHALLLSNNRLFHIEEISPRFFARLFGIFPNRVLSEVDTLHINLVKTKLRFGPTGIIFVQRLVILSIILIILPLIKMIDFTKFDFIIELLVSVLIILTSLYALQAIIAFAKFIPRQRLAIYTRFGEIMINHIKDMKEFVSSVNELRGLLYES